ncbi:MAG: LacI family DNA-binding transcriptional regulator [Anaerolineales bacterium]|nr:LacI family DNA-binding transcriptional regulator [Anaerolineales bacterium]
MAKKVHKKRASKTASSADVARPAGVSQIDVAQLADVSQAAVSRVFTPDASVSDEMREKVLAAAEKLGYRPNVIARSLVRQSTNMIGLVVIRFTNPFYARMIRDFTRALQNRGYWTLLLNIQDSQEVEKTLPMALQYRVDGIIVTSATLSSKLADECARLGTPVVLFNRYALTGNVNAVRCDNVGGGRMVADALLDAGHQRIAYIAGEEGSSTNRDRERGFTERLQERGYILALRESGDYTYESGHAAARRLLQRDDSPDAIFCASDLMAMGALDLARYELGIRVPEELSIIGFDDIPMVGWPRYSLTTIRQPVDRMVDATIQVLVDAIEAPGAGAVIRTILPTLVVRSSARIAKADSQLA